MANYTYDPGPQLPNYMKKRAEAGAPSGTARAAKETAPRKKTSSSTARSGGGTARKVSSGVQAGRTAKPQTQKRGTNSSKTTHSAAKTTNGVVSAKKRGGTTGENKRKKAQQRKRMLHVLLVAAVGLAGIICIIWLANRDDTGNIPTDIEAIMSTKKTFRDGVKLIGVDVSGMTPEEATGLVKYAAEKRLEKVAVTVALEDAGWTFSASDLGMSYDLTEMFVDGLAYGRSDDSEVQDVLAAGAGEFDAEYTWSRETILLALAQLEPSINTEATQPYAEPITDWESEERFNYIAGAEGRALNAEATADKIEYALRTGEFVTTVEPVVNAVLPTNTIDEVKAHTQYISEYTTTFSAARDDETKQNRLFNIRKAADIINGNTIRPGEQWSFNTVVGPRTFELGWKAANGISGGKEYTCRQAAASASRARRFTTHCFVRAQIWTRVRILRLWTGVRTPSRPTMWMLGWMQRWIRAALTLCSRTIPNTRCSFLRRLRMWRGAAADTRSQFMCMANRCRKASPINPVVRSPR